MSTVLHPEGPEEPRTYWVRRGLSVGVLVLVVLLVALIWPRSSPPQTAAPLPAVRPSQTAGADAPSPGVGEPPTVPATPAVAATPNSTASASPLEPTKAAISAPKPTPKPAGPSSCAPKDLQVGLVGPRSVRSGQTVKFNASVTNTGQEDCQVSVDQKNFELRVFSGSDKIFTTDHCRAWAPVVETQMLAAGESVQFQAKWGSNRTAKGCKVLKQRPQPGTYVATAELGQAKPAQHVVNLT